MIKLFVIGILLFGASCGAAVAPRSGQVAPGPLPPPASCEGESECTMQCDRNIATGCTQLGALLVEAKMDLDSVDRMLALFEKACTLEGRPRMRGAGLRQRDEQR